MGKANMKTFVILVTMLLCAIAFFSCDLYTNTNSEKECTNEKDEQTNDNEPGNSGENKYSDNDCDKELDLIVSIIKDMDFSEVEFDPNILIETENITMLFADSWIRDTGLFRFVFFPPREHEIYDQRDHIPGIVGFWAHLSLEPKESISINLHEYFQISVNERNVYYTRTRRKDTAQQIEIQHMFIIPLSDDYLYSFSLFVNGNVDFTHYDLLEYSIKYICHFRDILAMISTIEIK